MDSDSASDDDCYVNTAARIKALKKKGIRRKKLEDSPESEAEVDNGVDDDFWGPKTPEGSEDSSSSTESPIPAQNRRPCTRSSRSPRAAQVPKTAPIEIPDDDSSDVAETIPAVNMNRSDSLNCTADLLKDIEDDNYTMNVKVNWRSHRIVRLEIRMYETFQKIFQHFAQLEGVPENQILLSRNNKRIQSSDTPVALDLKVIDILEGGIIDAPVSSAIEKKDTENMCKIKVQMSTKQKIVVDLRMDETFKTVVLTCAEQLGVKSSQIKLSFDGEEITPDDTPESLDLEQEACIDLRIIPL